MEQREILRLGINFVEQLVALQLQGNVNLLLSTKNVLVSPQRIALKQTSWEKNVPQIDHYEAGFAAPESYQGHGDGATAVYFVGAVLYTLFTETPPPDARQRKSAPLIAQDGSPLARVINDATAPNPNNRIPNLEWLLERMIKARRQYTTFDAQKEKMGRGRKAAFSLLVTILLLIAAFFGYTAVQYYRLDQAFREEAYSQYLQIAEWTPGTAYFMPQEYDYSLAQEYIAAGEYKEAIAVLRRLNGFRDSEELIIELKEKAKNKSSLAL